MPHSHSPALTATNMTKQALGQAAPWVFFLAVVGYAGVGLLAALGVAMAVLGDYLGTLAEFGGPSVKLWPIIGAVYLGLGVLTFFPTRLLHRIARSARLYGRSGASHDLEGVAVTLRSLARYWGACTLVLLVIYATAVAGFAILMLANRAILAE
jgi:hypothetical protein